MSSPKSVAQIIAGISLLVILSLMLRAMRKMENGLTAGLVLFGLLTLTICAYLVAWRAKQIQTRTTAAILVACILLLFGLTCMFAYAIPSLEDLHNSRVSLVEGVVGNIIIWSISLTPLIVAFRCLFFVFRKTTNSSEVK